MTRLRAAALSLAGIRTDSEEHYKTDLSALLQESGAEAAVLPAYGSLVLGLASGRLSPGKNFAGTVQAAAAGSSTAWQDDFLAIHSALARENGLYLAAGTIYEKEGGRIYQVACCFDPGGDICCHQRQTHLTRFERDLGLSRGEELALFDLQGLPAGLVVGVDARHPEVGRGFALLGADILLHSGALEEGPSCWPAAAGMWAQVQQNQFWAVEAFLCAAIAGTGFAAGPAVIGPCEVTPGQSGYLARGYPHTPLVCTDLEMEALRRIRKKYPLLKLLNPRAYRNVIFDS